jgi:TatA/E family protein of Tat protein translocase
MIGPQDLWVALSLAVFFFGAKKLPELSRSLGQALAQFKTGLADSSDETRSPDAAGLASQAAASPDPKSPRPDPPV